MVWSKILQNLLLVSIASRRGPGEVTATGHQLSGFSRVQLFVTPWTVAHQAPLSMGFPRQEGWSGLPFPPPGDLPNLEIELKSPASSLFPALAVSFFTISTTWEAQVSLKGLSTINALHKGKSPYCCREETHSDPMMELFL